MEKRRICQLQILSLAFTTWLCRTDAIQSFRAIDILNQHDGDIAGSDMAAKTTAGIMSTTDDITATTPTGDAADIMSISSLEPPEDESGASSYDDVEEMYIEQALDHFSKGTDTRTFSQRFFHSGRYAQPVSRINPPVYVFLCVGGEGPDIDMSVLVDSVHCSGDMVELARILHEDEQTIVHMFALEHRYYGYSYPYFFDDNGEVLSPVTNENLVYLSSRQALADLAHFIETMNDDYSLKHAKWIAFGGSYPGMLAAWARLQYPKLVHAAVSSSAPLEIQLDFAGYKDRQAYGIQYDLVGGSEDCLQIVLDGHDQIVQALASGYYTEVANLFNICDTDSLRLEANAKMFVGDGVIEIPSQVNDPSCIDELCNIEKLCETMVGERNQSISPMEILAMVSNIQNGEECIVLDWKRTLAYLSSPNAQQDGIRSWLWQTCNEFGFYQTCEHDSLCPFGRGFHTLDMDFEICEQAFSIDRQAVVENVNRSLDYYGGWNIEATRILSVNGDVDPWSMLALTNDRNSENLPTHWVKGASHHYWTHPLQDTDDQELKDARDLIYLKVMEWLEMKSDVVLVTPDEAAEREEEENYK